MRLARLRAYTSCREEGLKLKTHLCSTLNASIFKKYFIFDRVTCVMLNFSQ